MSAAWWSEKPWRMIQTNMREIDMADLDAKRYAADMVSFGATVCMPSVAGIVANYPTKLPYHFINEHLTGDSLRQLVDECRKKGLRIIGRMDFSKVRRPIYEQHPEWAYVGSDGEIVDFNGNIHICFNSEYYQALSMDIIRECVEELNLDGIFVNAGGYYTRNDYSGRDHGPCQCENCRRVYEEMFGEPLPAGRDADKNPRYQEFIRRTTEEFEERYRSFLDEFGPGFLVANYPDREGRFVRMEAGTYLAYPAPAWCYESSMFNKNAALAENTPTSITTDDFIDMTCRFSSVSPYQQELRLAQSLAEGNCLDWYLMGRLDNKEDRSGFAGIRKFFFYHKEHEELYSKTGSKADILLIQTVHPHFTHIGARHEYEGWFKVLSEGHRLFDAAPVELLDLEKLRRYKLIILPDSTALYGLKGGGAEILDEYVRQGGRLLVTGGIPTEIPQLWPCLGIEKIDGVLKDLRSAYFRFLQNEQHYENMPDTDLVYINGIYVKGVYAAETEQRMQMIPPCPYGPPENCYYTEVTDDPAIILHPYGDGVGAYIPWLPGDQLFRDGYLVMYQWMDSVLSEELKCRGLGGTLPHPVQVTLRERPNGDLLLHLVNASGFFCGVYREPLTLSGLKTKIPCLKEPGFVRSLVSRKDVPFEWADGELTVYPDPIGVFDAIHIEF